METIYLSRRNLQTLLNKLERNKAAGTPESRCAIVKFANGRVDHEQTMDACMVVAVEDEEYYTYGIPPGAMHPADEPS